MPEWLPILIFIFAFILLFDSIASFVMYKATQHKLYKIATIAWGANFVNFLIHGAFPHHGSITLFGHSIFFIAATAMAFILFEAVSIERVYKRYAFGYLVMLLSSVIVYETTQNYMLAALILDSCIAAVFFEAVYQYWKSQKQSTFLKYYSILLVLNALHFLDYPFLHDSPKGSIFGFSLAFLLSFMMSILLPAMILQFRMQKYTDELEEVVEKRTTQLVERGAELEEKNKDISTLLSIVSHDISNPLQMMNFNVRVIKKEIQNLSENAQRNFEKIEKHLQSVIVIIKTVRELHATKLGKIEPKKVQINIIPLVFESIQVFQNRLDEKQIMINVIYEQNEQLIAVVDPLLFVHQVLGNLLSNAIKFSPPNSKIDIYLCRKSDSIEIKIRDYGIGIPHTKIDKIFDVHMQTTSDGTQKEKGTGLGLPTVKAILEKMGGAIHVESKTWIQNDENTQNISLAALDEDNSSEFGTVFCLNVKAG